MANCLIETVKGNFVFRSDAHQKRWVDAIGPDVVKFIDDFTQGVGTDSGFDSVATVTNVNSSTVTRTDGSGGFLLSTADTADNDGNNIQWIGESFELTSDQVLYFGAFGVTISEATQSDFFIGLAVTDTDVLGGVTDSIGFRKVDASTSVGFMVEKDSTETVSAGVLTADTSAHDYEFFYDGGTGELMVFVDGAAVTAPATTNLPDNEALRPTIHHLAGTTGGQTMTVDKLVCIQIGR